MTGLVVFVPAGDSDGLRSPCPGSPRGYTEVQYALRHRSRPSPGHLRRVLPATQLFRHSGAKSNSDAQATLGSEADRAARSTRTGTDCYDHTATGRGRDSSTDAHGHTLTNTDASPGDGTDANRHTRHRGNRLGYTDRPASLRKRRNGSHCITHSCTHSAHEANGRHRDGAGAGGDSAGSLRL